MVKIDWIEHAQELFGEQRYMTEEEQKMNKEILEKSSVPIGVNVFDLLKTYYKEEDMGQEGTCPRSKK